MIVLNRITRRDVTSDYLKFIKGEITKEEFNAIEDNLKSVRLELGFGQLKSAMSLLEEIPQEKIGTNFYNNFFSSLDKLINELYVNQYKKFLR